MATVREKTWVWGHPKNSLSGGFGLKDGNDATPLEGMKYLGAKNLFWIPQGTGYFDADSESKQMQENCINFGWCLYKNSDIDKIISDHKKYPSYKICILDDFFNEENTLNNFNTMSIEWLTDVKKRLNGVGMELWMVLYEKYIDVDLTKYLPCFDGISFWFWSQPKEDEYHKTVAKFIEKTPNLKRLIGCYLYDFGREKECDENSVITELNNDKILLKKGLVEGVILHTNAVSGFNFKAYEKAAKWMKENGDSLV